MAPQVRDAHFYALHLQDITPTATATATQPTCVGAGAPDNGTITISGSFTNERYQYSAGATFNSGAAIPALITAIPVGGVITSTLPNTTQQYTVRIYDAADDACFVDRVVSITAVNCPVACALTPADLTLSGLAFGPGSAPASENVTLNAGVNVLPESNIAGFNITSSEGSFYAFCSEINQAVLPLQNPYIHIYNGAANGFTAAVALRIAQVVQASGFNATTGFGPGNNTVTNFVALQMAVWNALYDTDYSISVGSFQMLTDNNPGVRAQANAWLTTAQTIAAPTVAVHNLYHPTRQDLLKVGNPPATITVAVTAPTCAGVGAPNNGGITIGNFTNQRYQYSTGVAFDAGTALPVAITAIPVGGVIVSNLPNTSLNYTVRIYDATDDNCYVDQVVSVTAAACCTVTINSSTPSVCDPATNKYSLAVNVSWTNASGTTLTVSVPGGSATLAVTAGSNGTNQTITITGLTANGTQDIDVTAQFDATCTATTMDAYDAPANCCPPPYSFCSALGENFDLAAQAGLTGYQWYLNGNPIPGANAALYNTNIAGVYTWTALDGASCPIGGCCPITLVENCMMTAMLTHDKTGPVIGTQQPNGSYNVTYTITVTNGGSGAGTYSLYDTPTFDDDIAINGTPTYTTNAPGHPANIGPVNLSSINGTSNTLATGQAIAAAATHTYMLTYNVTLNLEPASGGNNMYTACGSVAPGTPVAGQGLFNQSRLDAGNDGSIDETDQVCGDLPYLVLTKTADAVTDNGGGNYTITYTLTASNLGGAAANYTLTDTPGFDDDATITGCELHGTSSAGSRNGADHFVADSARAILDDRHCQSVHSSRCSTYLHVDSNGQCGPERRINGGQLLPQTV
jgi:hypothetical protein